MANIHTGTEEAQKKRRVQKKNFGWSGDTVTGSSKALLSPEPCSVNKQLRQSRQEDTHQTHTHRQSE